MRKELNRQLKNLTVEGERKKSIEKEEGERSGKLKGDVNGQGSTGAHRYNTCAGLHQAF